MYPKLTRISYTARSSDLAVLLAFLACLAQTKAECLLAPARQVLLDTLKSSKVLLDIIIFPRLHGTVVKLTGDTQ
tara:strand:- start:758 stop:982 length:225 start_codon:yes stop_codon:yes gene_type:complete